MKSAKLVTYLSQISKYQTRIQISKQILAHNMNFSPAWILAILQQKSNNNQAERNDNLKISQLSIIFDLIGLQLAQDQVILIFQYFDKQGLGLIKNKDFVQIILPNLKDGLKKAVTKRIAQDIELTNQLKYAFKRFFKQILGQRKSLKLYEGSFGPHIDKYLPQSSLSKQKLQSFMKKYGKHPTETQLNLILNFIEQGKVKQLPLNQLCYIIEESQNQTKYLSNNPGVLNQKIQNQLVDLKVKQLQGLKELQKALKKSQRLQQYHQQNTPLNQKKENKMQIVRQNRNNQNQILSQLKIQRTNSILSNQLKPENKQASQDFKKASIMADKLLLNLDSSREYKQKQQSIVTPYNRIDQIQLPSCQYKKSPNQLKSPPSFSQLWSQPLPSPTIYYSSRRKNKDQEFNQFQNVNALLQAQISLNRKQNQLRSKSIKNQMATTGRV